MPLEWYHSATFAFFPDETAAMIRRVYENPFEGHARRHFCGFCGTPLTYWSEGPGGGGGGGPRGGGGDEAGYIQVTMGSLCREDLGDLEDMGLIVLPSESGGSGSGSAPTSPSSSSRALSRDSPAEGNNNDDNNNRDYRQQHPSLATSIGGRMTNTTTTTTSPSALAPTVRGGGGSETTGIPWFDTILEGSRLAGRLRATRGLRQGADGAVRVEWEVVEYTDDDDDAIASASANQPGTPSGHGSGSGGKRKMDDRDDADDTLMEGVGQ